MTEEAQTQAPPLAGALDDAGDIRHDERAVVAIAHDAEVRLQRSERIVGNLRFGRGDDGKEGGLPGVGKAHETDVGQELQLENNRPLLGRFAGLGITRGLIRGRPEIPVAEAAASAFEEHNLLSVLRNIANKLARFRIIDHCAAGHLDYAVFAVFAEAALGSAAFAVRGKDMPLELEVEKCPIVAVSAQIDMAAPAAVAAVGTALREILRTAEMGGAAPAFTRTAINLYVIYKVGISHVAKDYLFTALIASLIRPKISSMEPMP